MYVEKQMKIKKSFKSRLRQCPNAVAASINETKRALMLLLPPPVCKRALRAVCVRAAAAFCKAFANNGCVIEAGSRDKKQMND